MSRSKKNCAGFSMIEVTVATALATLVVGGVVVVQDTATSSFTGSVGEQRATMTMRDGVSEMKRELRSVLASSLDFTQGSTTGATQGGTQGGLGGTLGGTLGGLTDPLGGLLNPDGSTPWNQQTTNAYDGRRMLKFQQAVSFDASTGATSFGGGSTVGGSVEYVVDGTDLVRRVRDGSDTLIASEERVLVSGLDVSDSATSPVDFSYDTSSGYMSISIRTSCTIGGRTIRRSLNTVVHLESVFQY